MSQRESGYARVERDSYPTPEWVTQIIVGYLGGHPVIWEPAAGAGQMVDELQRNGIEVVASDVVTGDDFLAATSLANGGVTAIVTNPPYVQAQEFIEHALKLTKPARGLVAMLLRCDFDSASTRRHLFADCPQFWAKVVLTKRIQWFAESNGRPSFNHAWFVWNWQHSGAPSIFYAP